MQIVGRSRAIRGEISAKLSLFGKQTPGLAANILEGCFDGGYPVKVPGISKFNKRETGEMDLLRLWIEYLPFAQQQVSRVFHAGAVFLRVLDQAPDTLAQMVGEVMSKRFNPISGPILFDASGADVKELWQPKGVNHSDLFEVDPDGYRTQAGDFIDAQLFGR